MTDKDGGPAFPVSGQFYEGTLGGQLHHGMTLCDYFAAKALPAIIKETGINFLGKPDDFLFDAKLAYAYADAMLKARES